MCLHHRPLMCFDLINSSLSQRLQIDYSFSAHPKSRFLRNPGIFVKDLKHLPVQAVWRRDIQPVIYARTIGNQDIHSQQNILLFVWENITLKVPGHFLGDKCRLKTHQIHMILLEYLTTSFSISKFPPSSIIFI